MKALQIIRSEKLRSPGPPGVFIPQGTIERRGVQALTRGTDILARGLAEFGAMIQTSVRRDMVSHNYALAQRDIADAELNLKADPDHRSIPGKFSAALDDIRAKHGANILDPVARNMFQRKMFEYGNTREIQMKYYTWNRENEAQQAHLIEELDIKAGLIEQLNLDDLTTYRIYLEEGNDVINQTVAGGHMQAGAGAKLRIGFREESAKSRAARSVKSNPFDALAKLSAKGWKQHFPFISELERLDFMDKAQTRINSINAAVKRGDEEARLAAKEEKAAAINLVADDYLKRIETMSTVELLNFEPMEILNNDILSATGTNSKNFFLDLREKELDERLQGKKNPYKIDDQKVVAQMLEDAMDGKLDPRDVHVIPNVVSMDAMRTLKNEARVALGATGDTLRKQYQELKKLAVNDGRRQILVGSELTGFDASSMTRANDYTQNLLKALIKEKDLEKRISMLTIGSPDYIIDKLVVPHMLTIREQLEALGKKFQPGGMREQAIRILRNRGEDITDEKINALVKELTPAQLRQAK